MTNDAQSSSGGIKITPHLIMLGVLVIVALIFIVQNTGKMKLDFLFLHLEMPKWLFIIVLLALGMAIDRMVMWVGSRRAKKSVSNA